MKPRLRLTQDSGGSMGSIVKNDRYFVFDLIDRGEIQSVEEAYLCTEIVWLAHVLAGHARNEFIPIGASHGARNAP